MRITSGESADTTDSGVRYPGSVFPGSLPGECREMPWGVAVGIGVLSGGMNPVTAERQVRYGTERRREDGT